MKKSFLSIFKIEKGSASIEYSLIVGLIAIILILALTTVGINLNELYVEVVNALVG